MCVKRSADCEICACCHAYYTCSSAPNTSNESLSFRCRHGERTEVETCTAQWTNGARCCEGKENKRFNALCAPYSLKNSARIPCRSPSVGSVDNCRSSLKCRCAPLEMLCYLHLYTSLLPPPRQNSNDSTSASSPLSDRALCCRC